MQLLLLIIAIILLIYWFVFVPTQNKETYWRYLPPGPFFGDTKDKKSYVFNIPVGPLKLPIYWYKEGKQLPSKFSFDIPRLSPVRDQGKTNFCWAYVITSILSDHISIPFIFGQYISVADLVSCYPFTDPISGAAAPEQVLQWMSRTRIKLRSNQQIIPTVCRASSSAVGVGVDPRSIVALVKYLKTIVNDDDAKQVAQNVYNIKCALLDLNGPVYAGISMFEDFLKWDGDGVYQRKSDTFYGGHLVEIVGWCDANVDTRTGYTGAYWICRNSFGTDWATKYEYPGFFAIRMGYNELGIESRVGSIKPMISIPAQPGLN